MPHEALLDIAYMPPIHSRGNNIPYYHSWCGQLLRNSSVGCAVALLYQFVISPLAALGRCPILPLFSSHTTATSFPNLAITVCHQLTASYLLTGRPSCGYRGSFSHRDLTTFMYQHDRAVRTHPMAATSMTKCSHPFCTLTP